LADLEIAANVPAMTTREHLLRYLLYPRILFTAILCLIALVLHVAFGLYVWLVP
jgi:hypothetical protein